MVPKQSPALEINVRLSLPPYAHTVIKIALPKNTNIQDLSTIFNVCKPIKVAKVIFEDPLTIEEYVQTGPLEPRATYIFAGVSPERLRDYR